MPVVHSTLVYRINQSLERFLVQFRVQDGLVAPRWADDVVYAVTVVTPIMQIRI